MSLKDDEIYMGYALEQAQAALSMGEVPVGAVVVCNKEVIAKACNCKETQNDPTGHAEIVAMRKAAKYLDNWRLENCTIYVTLEPCSMCAGAMVQARISRCVIGADDPKAGAIDSIYAIGDNPRLNHSFPSTFGVREDECRDLLEKFFMQKRSYEDA